MRWAELPGFAQDDLADAWGAWLRSCERPAPAWQALCGDVRRLSIAEPAQQRDWMVQHLQPYRVEALTGGDEGLLTGYYEPLLEASRTQRPGYTTPLYRLPAGVNGNTIDIRTNYLGTANGEVTPTGLAYTITAMPTIIRSSCSLGESFKPNIIFPRLR